MNGGHFFAISGLCELSLACSAIFRQCVIRVERAYVAHQHVGRNAHAKRDASNLTFCEKRARVCERYTSAKEWSTDPSDSVLVFTLEVHVVHNLHFHYVEAVLGART